MIYFLSLKEKSKKCCMERPTVDFNGTVCCRGPGRDGALVQARLPVHEAQDTPTCRKQDIFSPEVEFMNVQFP
jgi:hypothetical protein